MDNLFLTDLNLMRKTKISRSERVRQERLLDNSFDQQAIRISALLFSITFKLLLEKWNQLGKEPQLEMTEILGLSRSD